MNTSCVCVQKFAGCLFKLSTLLFGYNIWNDFILVTFSYDILDIHVILSSIMDARWMKTCNDKMTSAFLLSHHCLLVKCTINIWLQLFAWRIWNNILLLKSITNCLKHLIIDFLVVKDKISVSEWCMTITLKWYYVNLIKKSICINWI
jgi:hypothetical protein